MGAVNNNIFSHQPYHCTRPVVPLLGANQSPVLWAGIFTSHFTGSVLRRAKDKLQRKNIELQTAVSRMEDVERELLIAHGELEKRVEERTSLSLRISNIQSDNSLLYKKFFGIDRTP